MTIAADPPLRLQDCRSAATPAVDHSHVFGYIIDSFLLQYEGVVHRFSCSCPDGREAAASDRRTMRSPRGCLGDRTPVDFWSASHSTCCTFPRRSLSPTPVGERTIPSPHQNGAYLASASARLHSLRLPVFSPLVPNIYGKTYRFSRHIEKDAPSKRLSNLSVT